MREIKFRAKRIATGKWIFGTPTRDLPTRDCDGIIEDGIADTPPRPIDPATIGQYTGLKDDDGVEIYEGDIVDTGKHIGCVRWMPGKCSYQVVPGGVFLSHGCRVIGNIHDNPELLEEKGGEE